MIIGPNSIWKMAALAVLCLFAVFNVIGTYLVTDAAYHGTPLNYWWSGVMVVLNSVIVVAAVVVAVIFLWNKWDDKSDPEKQESK